MNCVTLNARNSTSTSVRACNTNEENSTLASVRLGEEEEKSEYQENKVDVELREARNELKEFKERTCNEILTLRAEKIKLQKEVSRLNCALKKLWDKFGRPSSLIEGITSAINFVADQYYKTISHEKLGKAIVDMRWSFQNGVSWFEIMKHARTYLRQNVFPPQAILEAIDMTGGTCNRKAYQIIRNIEHLSNDPLKDPKKRGGSSVLPHE